MKPSVRKNPVRGFTLIVTLSLMILLTVIAVGLLTLSGISIRASGQSEAMARAKANARLALMMALGDLQKALGPDKAVSATSEMLAQSPSKPNLAGVWESWNPDLSSSSLNYQSEKQNRFRRWLVSSTTPADVESRDFATSGWTGKTIELVGNASLGGNAPDSSKVTAGEVPISKNGVVQGAYAWHVSDESVKARINLYRDPSRNATVSQKRALLAGHRPDPSVMKSPDGGTLDFLPNDYTSDAFGLWSKTVGKVTGLGQVDLLESSGNAYGKIRPFRNEVTPYSLGLLTDVRSGGLKQDLSSIFELSTSPSSIRLPDEFNGKRLYQSTHGIIGVSDPYWSALSSYYNTFRVIDDADSNPTYYQPPSQSVPVTTATPQPSTRFFAGPVIEKVEMLFSFVARDSHSNWVGTLHGVDPQMSYMGHLVFTPLVTLHNPYNVNISFDSMNVTIANPPAAFNFYINNRPQSSGLVPLSEMFVNGGQRNGVSFVMNISNWTAPTGTRTSGPIVMKPGQTLVCGPYLDQAASFNNNRGTPFFDWENNLTGSNLGSLPINAKPGFAGRCVGYDVDWTTPTHNSYSSGQQTDNNQGVMGLRLNDTVRVEYGTQQPFSGSNTTFQVSAKITVNRRAYDYGGLDFKYQDNATLKKLFPTTYNYPSSGSFPASRAYVNNDDPVSRHANAQTIAVFSAYARTTSGGVYDNGSRQPAAAGLSYLRDGRLAGMPFLFHNPARTVVSTDLRREKPGAQSHEMNFQPFLNLGQVEDYFNLDTTNRTSALTGNTTQRGIKSGSIFELPTGPMQTIADFRRSNALTSSYLPSFVQPVSNSMVSPLMSTDKVVMTDSNVASYPLLDHSALANHALYDRFYFSTIATVGGQSPEAVFEEFMNSKTPLPSQAFQPYLPAGATVASAKSELFSAGSPTDSAYQNAAKYQMVRGSFNVNSTNVQAWKAMLASMNKGEVVTLWAKSAGLETVKSTATPILPMSMINGGISGQSAGVDAAKVDNTKTNDWNGHRELSDSELDTLATKIVDQVRLRGPFLSMSEFVNRRIGSESAQTRMGALEAAITESKINAGAFKDQIAISESDLSDKTIYPYNTIAASVGNPAAGAPGWISQGDLMRIIEPTATVRSDTFVIRVCGEAKDPKGNVIAKVYAEAVAQRLPEYVDPTNSPSLNAYTDSTATQANKTFGRRINIVSFRWLTSSEI